MVCKPKDLRFALLSMAASLSLLLAACGSRSDIAMPDLTSEAELTAESEAASQTETAAAQPPGATTGETTEDPAATPTEVSGPTSTPNTPTGPSRVGPYVYPEGVNPLTGLMVEDPELLDRRPLMIKVSNFPVSGRPHAGLSYADLVFEYYLGAGSTRFIALFYGENSPRVGPIRSGRLVDAQLVSLYGGILGMMRASGEVWDYLKEVLGERVLSATSRNCPALCQETQFVTGVYSDTAALTEYVESIGVNNTRPALDGMLFDVQPPPGSDLGERLWMFYAYMNQAAWDYDRARGVYLRLQDNADGVLRPMPDRLTDEQLAFENVVVIFAHTDVERRTLITINLWDAVDGRALVFRDGRAYWTTYTAPSVNQPLRFYDASHQPFAFKPGHTWFEIVGVESPIVEIEEGSWKVNNRVP